MIPAGYMAKHVSLRPQWLKAHWVSDVYSVSNCISKTFAEYIGAWMHNGYWFFDSPEIIRELAHARSVDLTSTSLFYYEVHDLEFDAPSREWRSFVPEASFKTQVVVPDEKELTGYDVVTFSFGNSAECSPLSCNALADEMQTNQHCLLSTLEQARQLLEWGRFDNTEPGPYRIFAVHSVRWP